MRATGLVDDVADLHPHDHICWSYEDDADRRERVTTFLADGAEQGQQLWYVGDGSVIDLRDELDSLGAAGVQVWSIAEAYGRDAVLDPVHQVDTYARATAQATAAGFTGLRVAADATALIRTPRQLDAFARYEHLIDRYMTAHPFVAMCAFDRREVGDAVSSIACLHPVAGTGTTAFRLFATDVDHAGTSRRGGKAAHATLAGEIDLDALDQFDRALTRADLHPCHDELVIDAADLDFVDHRGLLCLRDHARRRGADVVMRTAKPTIGRLIDILALDGIRAEVPA